MLLNRYVVNKGIEINLELLFETWPGLVSLKSMETHHHGINPEV